MFPDICACSSHVFSSVQHVQLAAALPPLVAGRSTQLKQESTVVEGCQSGAMRCAQPQQVRMYKMRGVIASILQTSLPFLLIHF